jgi:isoleucyl-tRNA synthetase
METARKDKLIGNSLEAAITLSAPEKLLFSLRENVNQLKDIFIVSQVQVVDSPPSGSCQSVEIEGLSLLVTRAAGKKCERCWIYDPNVGESADFPTICPRCRTALAAIEAEGKS